MDSLNNDNRPEEIALYEGRFATMTGNTDGYVYLATHIEIPGLIKIGYTTQDLDDYMWRLSERYLEGYAWPFTCEYSVSVERCQSVERSVHERLKKYNLKLAQMQSEYGIKSREFFNVDLETARRTLDEVAAAHYPPDDSIQPGVSEKPLLLRVLTHLNKYDTPCPYFWEIIASMIVAICGHGGIFAYKTVNKFLSSHTEMFYPWVLSLLAGLTFMAAGSYLLIKLISLFVKSKRENLPEIWAKHILIIAFAAYLILMFWEFWPAGFYTVLAAWSVALLVGAVRRANNDITIVIDLLMFRVIDLFMFLIGIGGIAFLLWKFAPFIFYGILIMVVIGLISHAQDEEKRR